MRKKIKGGPKVWLLFLRSSSRKGEQYAKNGQSTVQRLFVVPVIARACKRKQGTHSTKGKHTHSCWELSLPCACNSMGESVCYGCALISLGRRLSNCNTQYSKRRSRNEIEVCLRKKFNATYKFTIRFPNETAHTLLTFARV